MSLPKPRGVKSGWVYIARIRAGSTLGSRDVRLGRPSGRRRTRWRAGPAVRPGAGADRTFSVLEALAVLARPDETQEDIMDILNLSTSFPCNGHRFRVGVDDGRTCDCGHIADSLLDRWRHLYAVGALISAPSN